MVYIFLECLEEPFFIYKTWTKQKQTYRWPWFFNPCIVFNTQVNFNDFDFFCSVALGRHKATWIWAWPTRVDMVCEWCIADISSASLSSEQTGYLDLTRSLEQKHINNPCCNWSVTFFKLVLGFAVGTTLALKWLNCWLRKRNGNRVMTGKLAKVKKVKDSTRMNAEAMADSQM